MDTLKQRFRRLRLPAGNGNGLEALDPVSVTIRAWGSEVVVAGWDDSFTRDEVEVSAMTLEEIFLSLVGQEGAK